MEETAVDVEVIEERLKTVHERIEQACRRAGRAPEDITLVAVTKTFPLAVARAARDLGLRHLGENRARELRDKARELPGTVEGGDFQWHMIGHLQTNKAKFVARHADRFDALDSLRLADALDKRATKNGRVLPCLVEVNISGAGQKFGVPPEETHAFLDEIAAYEHLRVEGLMGMASFVDDPEDVRGEFQLLCELFDSYDAGEHPHVQMRELSMGMSGDFEVAIEEGATQVRLGSALFGQRDYE